MKSLTVCADQKEPKWNVRSLGPWSFKLPWTLFICSRCAIEMFDLPHHRAALACQHGTFGDVHFNLVSAQPCHSAFPLSLVVKFFLAGWTIHRLSFEKQYSGCFGHTWSGMYNYIKTIPCIPDPHKNLYYITVDPCANTLHKAERKSHTYII